MQNEILDKIKEAEMILIGLGEEFDDIRLCRQEKEYADGRQEIEKSGYSWLLPAYDDMYRERLGSRVRQVLLNLAELIADKNYFVITTSTNDCIGEIPWKEGRFVAPCGGSSIKQCVHGCEEGLLKLTQEEKNSLRMSLQRISEGGSENADILEHFNVELGICPKCASPLILNNVYTEAYDENGYLGQWQQYTKWLQGTLNRKLLILELGVGMQCPSVIRWPFEKIAYYNQKALFYRVNEKLYQLSEELKGKGISICENSIDWLQFLC